jgi:hypothetical protein
MALQPNGERPPNQTVRSDLARAPGGTKIATVVALTVMLV